MAELKDWNTSAGANTGAPPAGWPEGMNPSDVNNTAREMMAVLARYQADREAPITTGGTATAYTLAPSGTYSAYAARMAFLVKVHVACGAAPTLNVGALGAKVMKWPDGTALAAGDLALNAVAYVVYDGTDFLVLTVPTSVVASAGSGLLKTGTSVALDVNGLAAETAPAAADAVPLHDASAGANRKMTLDNLFKHTNNLAEDTAPDEAADFLLAYDTSAAAAKKVKPNNLAITGTLLAGNTLTKNPYATQTSTTQAHGLSAIPQLFDAYLECLTAEHGYSIGDRLRLAEMLVERSSGSVVGWHIVADATNVVLLLGNNAGMPLVIHKTTPSSEVTLTAANWKVIVTPYLVR